VISAAFAPKVNSPQVIVNNNFEKFIIFSFFLDLQIIEKTNKQKQAFFIFPLLKKSEAYRILTR
jgi:hypothetical protein